MLESLELGSHVSQKLAASESILPAVLDDRRIAKELPGCDGEACKRAQDSLSLNERRIAYELLGKRYGLIWCMKIMPTNCGSHSGWDGDCGWTTAGITANKVAFEW